MSAVLRRLPTEEPDVTQDFAFTPPKQLLVGLPLHVDTHFLEQKLQFFGIVRQRFGFGVTTTDPCVNLIDCETFVRIPQPQAAKCPDAQTQGSLGLHFARIDFLP